MKFTYCDLGYFPFLVPEKDASFASSVGPQTAYPAGFSLDRALQIYWRAQNYALSATGNGVLGEVTQALAATGNLPPRNMLVGTASYTEIDGLPIPAPAALAVGVGLRQTVPGSGTITASGRLGSGTSTAALLNLLVDLFYPEVYVQDPMVKYAGQYWPAMSISCAVTNTVTLTAGGSESIEFDCSTLQDAASTTEIGSFSFFGVSVPVFCHPLAPADGGGAAETRTFTGSLSVAGEWA
jgi:hypothetical protein